MPAFRPATLGRDATYALSDPGHEHIAGLLECFFGPLAARLGVEGARATLAARENLYSRRSPDGSAVLLIAHPERYRPVHGGNFFAPLTLTAWMAGQDEVTRKKAERLLAE